LEKQSTSMTKKA